MSHAMFSMNQAARRNVTAAGRSSSACSSSRSWVSRFSCAASAPMVDRHTTRVTRAARKAVEIAAIVRRASVKPGDGSKVGGNSTNTASAPVNAAVSADASSIVARATSQPRSAQAAALAGSRNTARTGRFAASSAVASWPPTWPVIPVIANMSVSP